MHRFVWDFHATDADGPLAPPGTYVVRLSVAGYRLTQRLVLERDPRVRATDQDLVDQALLATLIVKLRDRVEAAVEAAAALRKRPDADVARIDELAGVPPADGMQNSPFVAGRPGTLRDD